MTPRLPVFPLLVAALAGAPSAFAATTPVAEAVEQIVRQPEFEDIALSPTGDYFAASVPQGDRTVLVVLRRADLKVTSAFSMRGKTHVAGFEWVNPTRLVLAVGQRFDRLEQPLPTGELYALNAEGGGAEILAGPRAAEEQVGSNLRPRDDGSSHVFLVDSLRQDPDHVLVSAQSIHATGEPLTRAERMDVESGRRRLVARAPVRRAQFLADPAGEVRFATGMDERNATITYYRTGADAEWQLVNSENDTGRVVRPVGFSADGTTVYLRVSHPEGPDGIEAMDVASGTRREVLRDPIADPESILVDPSTGAPIGVRYADALPRTAWFDPAHPAVRTYRSLEAAFPGQRVQLRSVTDDGRLQLVVVSSDRNPGDYYLFDTVAKTAEHVLSTARWIDPEQMAPMRPIALDARDGTRLRGFLTVPRGVDPKGLPLVVHPHGGPFAVQDTWRYNDEVQLLASQGYAVLQVNFRGSGGFGDAFVDAGAREWGRRMQDDLTDATRWAIAEGIADPARICIYGSSYGAYAALMGAVREPELYRCVAGSLGLYDLAAWQRQSDVGDSRSGRSYIDDFVGRTGLDAISPAKQAAAITVPVFLAAGGMDERTPLSQTQAMADALEAAGNPAQLHVYRNEGHGFYAPENRRDFYTRLLGFLGQHLAPSR